MQGRARVVRVPGHEIADGCFVIGAVEIDLGEGRAIPAEMIDDNVEIFGRCRINRGPITDTQLPLQATGYTGGPGLGFAFLA